ncbi:hypothetical protein D1P53_003969 [Cryptococcus gattii VGV]|nr:hypothetical protein D1P53_003969 [Cryptococcus gattii VGV]
MKLLVLLPLTLPHISDLLLGLGHSMLAYFSPSVQVIFVMAIFPLIMNIVQFCLVDQVIKAGGKIDDDDEESAGGAGGGGGGGGRVYGTGDEEEGYRRVPEWEHDLDGRPSGEDSFTGMTKKEREEGDGEETRGTGLPLSSPLLSPSRYDGYGSTTPSPVGSPTKSVEGQDLWTRMLGKSKGGGGSSSGSLKERLGAGKSGKVSRDTWWAYPEDEDEEDEEGGSVQRNTRSHAPSPESIRPAGLSAVATQNGSAMFRKNSRTPPEWGTSSALSSHTARRLTSELEREARLTLSPPGSPMVEGGGGERGEQVGLDVMHR